MHGFAYFSSLPSVPTASSAASTPADVYHDGISATCCGWAENEYTFRADGNFLCGSLEKMTIGLGQRGVRTQDEHFVEPDRAFSKDEIAEPAVLCG